MKWSMEGKGEGKDGCTESEPSYFIHSRKGASGYALSAFSAESKSGQFICYKSGQIYLLTTVSFFRGDCPRFTDAAKRSPLTCEGAKKSQYLFGTGSESGL